MYCIKLNQPIVNDKRMHTLRCGRRHYGYPTCCIEAFVIMVTETKACPTKQQLNLSQKTGYIPCQKLSNSEVANIRDLLTGRQCVKPFTTK